MKKHKPIKVGDKFTRLLVLSKGDPKIKPSGQKVQTWNCKCSCGNILIVNDYHLKTGNSKSCGCLNLDLIIQRNKSHNLSKTPEYKIWASMIQRCCNKNDRSWPRYGGAGISVCERWRQDFDKFYEDMGERPSKSHSIDRVDNNGNYEPGNCRWATTSVQNHNQKLRSTNTSGFKGVHLNKKNNRWYSQIQIDGKKIYLGCFENKGDAVKARKSAEAAYASNLKGKDQCPG